MMNGYHYGGGGASSSGSSRQLSNDGAAPLTGYAASPFNNSTSNGQSPFGAGTGAVGGYLPSLNTAVNGNGMSRVGGDGFGAMPYYASPSSYQSSAQPPLPPLGSSSLNGSYALPGPGPSAASAMFSSSLGRQQGTMASPSMVNGNGDLNGGFGHSQQSSLPGMYASGFGEDPHERRMSASAAAAAAAVLEGMVSAGGTGGRATPSARSVSVITPDEPPQGSSSQSQPKKKHKKSHPTNGAGGGAGKAAGDSVANMTQKEKDDESRRKTARACDVCVSAEWTLSLPFSSG